jgi:ADP-ribose pyrophosphatase
MTMAAMGKIDAIRVVFTTNWFSIEEKTLAGDAVPYFTLNCSDYISVVALTAADDLVLVRQFRPSVEEHTLELPSGHVDTGETAIAAAARELSEETGYIPESLHEMAVVRPDTGRLSNCLHLFFSNVWRPLNGWRPEPGIEVVELARPNVLQSLASGAPVISHAHCLAAIGIAVLQGRL